MDDNLKNFLNYIFDISDFPISSVRSGAPDEISCKNCGLTYTCLRETGKLGCANCYTVFREALVPSLKNIHGSVMHSGKIPKGLDSEYSEMLLKRELESYKVRLKKCIDSEDYEEAAQVRDKIRSIVGRVESNEC